MKKLSITLILLGTLFSACERDDSFGEEAVKVKATYIDDFNGRNDEKPLKNKMAFLKEKGSDHYLYTSTTNDEGVAEFEHINEGEFEIYFNDSINGIPYTGSASFESEEASETIAIQLKPDVEKVNGLRMTFVNTAGDRVPKIKFCLFQNEQLADSMNCAYSNYSGEANIHGEYQLLNVPADDYYMMIKDTISGIPVNINKRQITIDEKGLTIEEVTLF